MIMPSKLRYGLIGSGKRGRRLAVAAARFPDDVEIVAICDVLEEAQQTTLNTLKSNLDVYYDYRDLLERSDIDAVMIATPNHTHKQIVLDALSAGKHVLCEKPMATNLVDCKAMVDAAEASDRVVQIGFELRYAPIWRRMRDRVLAGDIGPIQMLWCHEFREPFHPSYENWRLKAISGGSLVEKNCHHFDLFEWMLEAKPVRVSAFGGRDVIYQDAEVIDNAWVNVEYSNGARASLSLCLFAPYDNHLEIGLIGSKGRLVASDSEQKLTLWSVGTKGATEERIANDPSKRSAGHHGGVEQQAAFISNIRDGTRPLTDARVGMNSLVVAFAAEESIRTGKTIDVEAWMAQTLGLSTSA